MAAIEIQPALTDPEPENSLSPLAGRILASLGLSVPELPQEDLCFEPETYIPEYTDSKVEAKANTMPVEPEEVARNGLFRQLRNFKDKIIYSQINLKVREMAGEEEALPVIQPEKTAPAAAERTPRHITVKRVGGAVLALAITGGIAYLAVKGMPHGVRPTLGSQEFLAPVQHTHDHTKAAADVLPSVGSPVKANPEAQQILHQRAANSIGRVIKIKPGDGYTQAIKKLFPGHTANEYYNSFKATINHSGPNFLKGVGHFRDAKGNWKLSNSGTAHISKGAYQYLSGYFKTHP